MSPGDVLTLSCGNIFCFFCFFSRERSCDSVFFYFFKRCNCVFSFGNKFFFVWKSFSPLTLMS
uniref:Uncharacterized protein n=1 Tax=uncultured marine virus TaxID=186617 RepID=A0A0F7L3R1_9VIRU|nr:hypothetical protein [uncultured marine virus]